MVVQTGITGKLTASILKAYALKTLFYSLDLIGNQLVLQKTWRGDKHPFAEAAYGPHRKQKINIIRPRSDWGQLSPVLIYFHGGGFLVGDKNGYNAICTRLADYGYVTFNVNYRLAPTYRYVAQTQDIANAIAWIYRHAGEYGGDCRRIALAGDSAGALHASWYASALECPELFARLDITQRIPRSVLKGLVLFYGLYDFETVLSTNFPFISTYVRNFLTDDHEQSFAEQADLLSPIRHVTANLPPVFLCAGENDGLVQESMQYAQALQAKGVKTRMVFLGKSAYPDAYHGFLYFANRQCTKCAFGEAARFLREVMAPKDRHAMLDEGRNVSSEG